MTTEVNTNRIQFKTLGFSCLLDHKCIQAIKVLQSQVQNGFPKVPFDFLSGLDYEQKSVWFF